MHYANPYIEECLEGPDSVFRGLSQADKAAINQNYVLEHFRKGGTIVREGSRNRGFLCLATGKAKVFRIGAGGREQIIRLLKPQTLIFTGCIIPDSQYPFTVNAIEDSIVISIKKQPLTRILRQNSELAFKFIKILADESQFSDRRLISLTQKHVRGRVAESLLLLRDTFGFEKDGKTLRIVLTRDDLAHFSNMTTSNAIRTISEFTAEGIISPERRRIVILDNNKLEEINDSGQ